MSEQPQQPQQNLNISDNASPENTQIGGIAGRNLNVTQIQEQVVYATVYDRFYAPDGLSVSGQPVNIKPLTQNEYRQRKVLLNKVKKFWIEGVLEKSLHNQILIELGFEEKPDAIQTPFPGVEEISEQSGQDNSKGTNVTEIFQQMGMGRTLLILGEPGSGKTITLLKIVQSLIEGVEQDVRRQIPVVLPLSSWATKQKAMKEWIIEELYQYGVSKPLGKNWIEEQQLILFLDGLDEVKAEYRNNCVRELNEFTKLYSITEIVVSCRVQDYKALERRLELQSAVCLQPLTQSQIYQYLDRSSEQLAALRTLLQNDAEVRAFVTSPLILSIISFAYRDCSLEELFILVSKKKWKQNLFDRYIERMFQRKRQKQVYKKNETKCWLRWLAQNMIRESKTVFLIEKIQPNWLNTQDKIFYRIILFAILGFLVSVCLNLFFEYFLGLEKLFLRIIFWFCGLVVAASEVFSKEIKIVNAIEIKWKQVLTPTLLSLLFFGGFFLLYGIFDSKVIDFIGALKIGLGAGLTIGASLLPSCGWLEILVIEKTTYPNQGIWKSARHSGILSLSLCIFLGIGLLMPPEVIDIINYSVCLTSSIFVVSVEYGGLTCIKHFILRLILYCNKHIPWNYARFLDYATDCIFLQKVGGGYIFVHRMLMEYFAQIELEQGES